jgi:diguanylate cyclase (GGDEF)-like protein
MDNVTETLVAVPKRVVSGATGNACLVHIYPTGPGMGRRYPLGNTRIVIGRESDCDIAIDDQSVSRRHACIQPEEDGYTVFDLQSTNGTYINDQMVTQSKLKDGDHVRIGNGIYRFLTGGNVEAEYHEEIYRLTIVDALTETYNKRYLLEFLDRELARSARFHRPLSLLMFDIDLFKALNDELGHLGGDSILRELSARVRKCTRKEEVFARYGGEEFAIVLVETGLEPAVEKAERVRQLVAGQPFQYEGQSVRVTVSVGVATTGGEEPLSAHDLIEQADAKLYQAKHAGRNRAARRIRVTPKAPASPHRSSPRRTPRRFPSRGHLPAPGSRQRGPAACA